MMGRRSRRRNAVRALAVVNNPTAYRIMRPGWEDMNYMPDPIRPGLAIAYRTRGEPAAADLVMIRDNRGSTMEGNA